LPVERKEETSTKHVPERAVRLYPVPPPTELLGEEPSACLRVLDDEIADLTKFPFGVGPSPIPYFLYHEKYVS